MAAVALTIGAFALPARAALVAQPGETIGIAFGKPLPEGVTFLDLEDYGRADGNGQPQTNTGFNIADLIWSTPFSFYDTRLEFIYIGPLEHRDGGGVDRVDAYSQVFGPAFAHEFGHGFYGSLYTAVRLPDEFMHRYTSADIRVGLSYDTKDWNISTTLLYGGTFGGNKGGPAPNGGAYPSGLTGASDGIDLDFALLRKVGKVQFGAVGYAYTEITTRGDNAVVENGRVVSQRVGEVAVGGLVGYDFGAVTVQGYATRQVATRYTGAPPVTRGWLRLTVPLYKAPTAPEPLRARF